MTYLPLSGSKRPIYCVDMIYRSSDDNGMTLNEASRSIVGKKNTQAVVKEHVPVVF